MLGKCGEHSTHQDLLAGFFNNLFQAHSLVDISPDELVPTWRNGRSGTEAISKRLDQVLLSEDLETSDGN
jgi:hypothetical protein